MQQCGATTPETGWSPCHVEREGAWLPLYGRDHSRGEYVFDFSWADAYQRHGLAYYPKLVTSVPFTPVVGPRWLGDWSPDALWQAVSEQMAEQQASGWHLLFPDLASRRGQRAGSLSGGQQQMLALARVLLHEPEVLLIDELSLGLAPAVIQDLLKVVERLQEQGQTIVVVEQSLNIALAIADRAIFLEKGQVRFEGPASELAERDDLARAVFLGREGG